MRLRRLLTALTIAVLATSCVDAASAAGSSTQTRASAAFASQTSAGAQATKVYEVKVKPELDLDDAAYKIYRGLSVGARKTNARYSGREGLHKLPDAKGDMNGGTIGFRRAAETSGKRSPAIDLNTPKLGDVRFHFVR